MNKSILFLLTVIFSLLLFVPLFADFASADSSECNLSVSMINQDPYPATPDGYVRVVFQISNAYDPDCGGAKFELIQSYPFSLDENDTWRILEESKTASYEYSDDWMIAYKLRVDKDALDGDNQIEVHYSPGNWEADQYIAKKFNITIEDSRTIFDAVIQEVSGSDVSIAIANAGKYTANSVVVRIPEQDSFRVSGATNGQMVGNLESGDYTIVAFTLSPKGMPNQNSELQFDIYYTDNIGERRIVNMRLPLSMGMGNLSMTGTGNFPGNSRTAKSFWSIWYTLLIILVVLIGLFVLYKKYLKTKLKLFKKKESHLHDGDKAPDWIKNAKAKEKKK